jgi:hypothetical protein
MENEVAEFVGQLLHSGTVAHFFHLSTNSYAEHKALQRYYEQIIELTDDFAESYMGRYGQLKKFPNEFHEGKKPLDYFERMKDFVEEARKDLPQDTELQNAIDAIADLINTTIFRIKYLTKD